MTTCSKRQILSILGRVNRLSGNQTRSLFFVIFDCIVNISARASPSCKTYSRMASGHQHVVQLSIKLEWGVVFYFYYFFFPERGHPSLS